MATSYPSSGAGKRCPPTPSPVTEPLSEGCPVVGDWAWLLSGDGIQQNATPYRVTAIEQGPDGQQYARFLETDTGWPLAQCERTDPPAPVGPPDDVEEF